MIIILKTIFLIISLSLLGAIFPLPRVLYAMGSDGIIFRFLAIVHPKYQTPLIATAVSGVFAGLLHIYFLFLIFSFYLILFYFKN